MTSTRQNRLQAKQKNRNFVVYNNKQTLFLIDFATESYQMNQLKITSVRFREKIS